MEWLSPASRHYYIASHSENGKIILDKISHFKSETKFMKTHINVKSQMACHTDDDGSERSVKSILNYGCRQWTDCKIVYVVTHPMLCVVGWGGEEGVSFLSCIHGSFKYTNPNSRQRLRLMSDEAVLKTHYFIFYWITACNWCLCYSLVSGFRCISWQRRHLVLSLSLVNSQQ